MVNVPSGEASADALPLPPAMQEGRPGRVVNVSSKLHYLGRIHREDPQLATSYNSLAAYAQSKLAQVGQGWAQILGRGWGPPAGALLLL